jgi:P4 family phage/plasmid primase-like protien
MIQLVQEALAVTMFQMAPKYQRCFLFYGVPHSGKSVFMEIIESLFPAQARTSIAPELWKERFMKAQLAGPILNLAGELPESRNIDSQIFKQVVNGEPIAGEHKNQAIFTFRPTAAHWFASNYLPKTQDVSAAFIRRWLILGFLHQVPEAQRDINLADDIVSTEKEAIVAWAVQALGRVMERGHLIVPRSCAALAAELSGVLNPVRVWFDQKAVFEDGAEVVEDTAYMSYQTFALMKGFKKLDRGLFRATMRELAGLGAFSCHSLDNGNQIYRGLKLLKVH